MGAVATRAVQPRSNADMRVANCKRASANALHNAAPDDCSAARVSICFPGHPRPAGWCDLSARPPQQVDRLQPRTYSTRISCPRAIASSGSDEATDHALHVESKGASMGTKELFAPWRATLPGLKPHPGRGNLFWVRGFGKLSHRWFHLFMNWKCWNYPAAAATQHNARSHSGPPST